MNRNINRYFSSLISTTMSVVVILLSAHAYANVEQTELHLYQPLIGPLEEQPMVITAKKSGDCLRQSQLIKREDAWRCMAEDKVFDPCFVQPFGSHQEAVCPESPWLNKGVKISVITPLDSYQHEPLNMSSTFPWALELSSGEKCQGVSSNEQFDGLTVQYQCEKNTQLIGQIQRCEGKWKMLQHASNGIETVEIERAWF